MANYSSDTRLRLIDPEIFDWLGEGESFQSLRDMVTERINTFLKRNGVWQLLSSRGLVTESGVVDTSKLANPSDLEDLEDTWLRELVYMARINSCKEGDALFWKARLLRQERIRRLRELVLLIDEDGDGVPDEPPIHPLSNVRG